MAKTREEVKEYMRQYRIKNKESLREKRLAWEKRNKDKIIEHHRQHYSDNRDQYRLRRRKCYEDFREKILGLKKQLGCKECGVHDIRILDFHHRDPSTKSFDITTYNHSWKETEKELEKCDVLCANCHRIEQWTANYSEKTF